MKILREPLLHFLLLGAGLFILFNFVNKRQSEQPDKIVVTTGKIQHLADTFSRTWQRPPTQEELDGLVRDYIREEVLYREGIAMGLNENDTVIRRRLRQKMEFISEDVASQTDPTEEDLQNYLKEHPEKFKTEPIFTFSQIFFNPERRGDSLTRDMADSLSRLNRYGTKIDISTLGDQILLESDFNSARQSEIARLFGEKFAEKLSQLEPGRWDGPVESGYGVHLVFIEKRSEGLVPALDEVRGAVQREWENDRRLEANEKFYQGLLERYAVVIERPENGSGAVAAEKEAKQ